MDAKKYLIVCLVGCVFVPFNLWGDGDVYCGDNIYDVSAESKSKSIGCVCRSGDTFILNLLNPPALYWKIVSVEGDGARCDLVSNRVGSYPAEKTQYECTCPDDNEILDLTIQKIIKRSGQPKSGGEAGYHLTTDPSREIY